MADLVEFFEDYVDCCHCGDRCIGLVYANTAQVCCEICGGVILDMSDTDGGMIVMLELEDEGSVH